MPGRPQKYGKLRLYLQEKAREFAASGEEVLKIEFKDIDLMGARLPSSAYKHRAWWANHPTKPWWGTKFKTESIDIENQRLKFRYYGPEVEPRKKRAELEQAKRQLEANPTGPIARLLRGTIDLRGKELNMTADPPQPAGLNDVSPPYKGSPPTQSKGSQSKFYLPRPASPRGTEMQKKGKQRCRHPIYGALKGYIRLVAGTDLTEPADPEWGKRVWGEDDEGKR